jgi:type IV secretory pathway component VirB8
VKELLVSPCPWELLVMICILWPSLYIDWNIVEIDKKKKKKVIKGLRMSSITLMNALGTSLTSKYIINHSYDPSLALKFVFRTFERFRET